MKKQNKNEEFLKKIFERSDDPIAQLERINSILPIFFTNPKNIQFINRRLGDYGYQINDEYVDELRSQFQIFGHPSCGNSNGYGGGHPSCGSSRGYGYGHPSCGSSNGYGSGHPSCGRGNSHPSCCSSKNRNGKTLLLINKNTSGRHNEIRN